MKLARAAVGLSIAAFALAVAARSPEASGEWRTYGGSNAGDHYSPLTQITKANVGQLREAWRFEMEPGGVQTSPLMIGGTLYAVTPTQSIVALDPATGKERWRYVPQDGGLQPVRGLSYWTDGQIEALFMGHGVKLTALSPKTGKPIETFGDKGSIDLRSGLGRDPSQIPLAMTTPGTIYRDLIITGFRTTESRPAAPGAIRAYDVRTGKLRWTFNTFPGAGEPGSETWPAEALETLGAANAWAGFALDEQRGILFVPTGSPIDDFYGGDRAGDNLYANSLIALNATTGKRLWHFQGVHHDIWDRDFPTPPVLLTVTRDGKRIDAVAQGSKQGFIFLFDRVTGRPLFPIEERPVPRSSVPGEVTSPTQPFPVRPAPAARQQLTANMLTSRTPEANAWARKAFAGTISGGPYTPLSLGKQTFVFPGFDGGMEWGGPAVDPRGILYVNSNDIAWTGGLTEPWPAPPKGPGEAIYREQCAACHGMDRKGSPPDFPSLEDVMGRHFEWDVAGFILRGKGRMPAFPHLEKDLGSLLAFLRDPASGNGKEMTSTATSAKPSRYVFTGYKKFLDPDGYPAVAPPWGTLSAIDMNSGDYLWKVPLGEYPALVAQGYSNTGSENYGGPVVTASGLLFIGATIYDRKFRAFDTASGKLLWQAQLPFAGVATPITYMAGGRQYVVIAASGQRDPKSPQGSAYVAFALP